jgi:hypothetical protein
MAFSISPGVTVSEVDLTTVVPSVSTTAGAFAGNFVWGPCNKRISVDSETTLNSYFFDPDANTYVSYYSAASFLAYGNNLKVVRALAANAKNATANSSAIAPQIANADIYEASYLNSTNNNAQSAFVARYTGALGNSLTVSIIDAGSTFSTWNINGIGVSSYFPAAPGTSASCSAGGGTNDEVHIVVMDTGGMFSGTKNTVLEVFPFASKGFDAVDSLGNSSYWKNVLFNNSEYIFAMDPPNYSSTSGTWGSTITGTAFTTLATSYTYALSNGADDTPSDSALQNAFSYFVNSEAVDISLVVTGGASIAVQQYVIDNIANARKDCVAFISPPSSAVVNQNGNEVTNITTWYNSLARTTSYAVADTGWKYMYDKYNNTYRYIPLNADIAGLCVYTDTVRDPWFSPAGYNRGSLKNVVKLAWNPNKSQRDTLYSLGINPVDTFPGQGTILFGDKTLQSKPSAFDRINVRRLFITLEKAISTASKFSLFEFNDDFTRNQFVALVTPFLRDIQGRRGIYDFRVVCDKTNNTPQVIDANQFVGDIYIKPARAVNFIQLNFVAARTGVDFSEVVGKF